jgi:hypothetical protein
MTVLSTRNCVSTSEPRAPIASRIPISRVRSASCPYRVRAETHASQTHNSSERLSAHS